MKKIVLFDLDYTLIDTDLLREKLHEKIAGILAEEKGKVEKIFPRIEKRVWQEKKTFDPIAFGRLISLHFKKPYAEKKIKDTLTEELPIEESLYPEVYDTLDFLAKKHDLGIFSEGDFAFQSAKIKGKLPTFLKREICYIFSEKIPEIPKIVENWKGEHLIIVDDKISVVREAGKFPSITGIWIKRRKKYEKEEKVDFLPRYTIGNLSELKLFL